MLYLIECFMRGDNDLPLRCLKVGYAKNVEERLKAYKTYNHSVKLLKTREGDYELENYLHKYFKKYELPNFNEWFIFSKKIIEEFELIEIQGDTITSDEYLECIRKEILYKLIPETYKIVFSKIPELLIDLETEFNSGLYNDLYSGFPKDFCKRYIKNILKTIQDKELECFNQINLSKFSFNFPQLIGYEKLKDREFKENCLFIYKLSDDSIMKRFEKISSNKIERSKRDLENFYMVKHPKELLEDLRDRVLEHKYNKDYTGIDEKIGIPKINKLVMILEKKVFELRSNIYKSNVQVHNEFSKSSTELLKDEITNFLK